MHEDEITVLLELTKNAKENINTIAKQCGFSRQKTWRIIKELESKRFIWGYTAVFDEEKIRRKHFILMLKRTSKPLKKGTAEEIASRRAENILSELGGTIETSCYVNGDYDWVVTFIADDILQAKKYADALIQLHPGEIEKATILQTLIFVKKHYILNPERKKLIDFL